MFRARMTEHKIQEPIKKQDGLGFAFDDYDEPRTVLMYITVPTKSVFNQNEFFTTRYDAVAFTFEDVPKGALIDGEFKVETANWFKMTEKVLELSRIGESANV